MKENTENTLDAGDTLSGPSDNEVWEKTYKARPIATGQVGRLNPEFTYYEIAPKRELAVSALGRAVLQWCQSEKSFESLFTLSCENFPEQAAVIEQELLKIIPALLARDLLEDTSAQQD